MVRALSVVPFVAQNADGLRTQWYMYKQTDGEVIRKNATVSTEMFGLSLENQAKCNMCLLIRSMHLHLHLMEFQETLINYAFIFLDLGSQL